MAKPAYPFELHPEHRARAATLAALRARIVLQQSITPADMPSLSPREEAVLLILVTRPGPHSCGSLAEALRIQRPAVVRAMDALERHAMAGRVYNPNDNRVPHYRALPRGVGLVERMSRLLADAIAETAPVDAPAAA